MGCFCAMSNSSMLCCHVRCVNCYELFEIHMESRNALALVTCQQGKTPHLLELNDLQFQNHSVSIVFGKLLKISKPASFIETLGQSLSLYGISSSSLYQLYPCHSSTGSETFVKYSNISPWCMPFNF